MLLAVAMWSLAAPAAASGAVGAVAAVELPAGYRVVRSEALPGGVQHVELAEDGGPQRVHVAAFAPGAGARIVPVLSTGRIAGPAPRLERTSSMCARVSCVVAVNADFFHVDTEQPVGALAVGGQLLRSPVATHHQLLVGEDGTLAAGVVSATVRLVSTDLRELATPQLNVARGADALVLYTPAFGPSTETNEFGAELVARVVAPATAVRIGETALVELVELRDGEGSTPIPPGGVVVSGHGKAAEQLRELWRRVGAGEAAAQLLVRVETTPDFVDTVGGAPVLVRDGRPIASDDGSVFARGRHPRTLVGWTSDGTVLLVTADGRQPGYAAGLSLPEAADLMVGLGAVEAINLDGGGSTTFVVDGKVANRPSDQLVRRGRVDKIVSAVRGNERSLAAIERPTVSALAIVVAPLPRPAPVATVKELRLPTTVDLAAPIATDPASNLSGGLPALVAVVAPDTTTPPRHLVVLAALLTVAVSAATARACRRVADYSRPSAPSNSELSSAPSNKPIASR